MISPLSPVKRKIVGVPALSGSPRFTRSSLSRISFIAVSRFVPYSNSNETFEEPSLDVEVRFLRPFTLITALSIILVTDFSTDSGSALGYDVLIESDGFSTSGIRAIATLLSVKIPSIPRRAKTMRIKTGCSSVLLLKLISFYLLFFYLLQVLFLHQVQALQQALHFH